MPDLYQEILLACREKRKLLAILVDPEKFEKTKAAVFVENLPKETTHLFIGGSTVPAGETAEAVKAIKAVTRLPIIIFPGDHSQITEEANALLFLSLISGRNPEYLIGQQVKAVKNLKSSRLQIIPTGYILVDGGKKCAVQEVSKTIPIAGNDVETVVHTALAGEFLGKKLIYLEAGSGAIVPVSEEIISAVKAAINIPLVVGGGIRTFQQQQAAYRAGADLLVMGNYFEEEQKGGKNPSKDSLLF